MMLTMFLPSIINQKRKKRAWRELQSSAAKVIAPRSAASKSNIEYIDWVAWLKGVPPNALRSPWHHKIV